MTIDDAIKRYTSNAFYEKSDGNLQGYLEFNQLAEWLKELKELREQTRWIPVSEKLPEESLNSIVGWDAYRERRVFVQYIDGRFQIKGKQESFNIIAWMPLSSEPYVPEVNVGEIKENEDKE